MVETAPKNERVFDGCETLSDACRHRKFIDFSSYIRIDWPNAHDDSYALLFGILAAGGWSPFATSDFIAKWSEFVSVEETLGQWTEGRRTFKQWVEARGDANFLSLSRKFLTRFAPNAQRRISPISVYR